MRLMNNIGIVQSDGDKLDCLLWFGVCCIKLYIAIKWHWLGGFLGIYGAATEHASDMPCFPLASL